MQDVEAILSQKSLVIILSYAPAGLGHLRVTDALYHGLPSGVTPVLLGSQDTSITFWHRLMSVHALGKMFMEWMQSGIREDILAFFYRQYLKSQTEILYRQLVTILDQRIDLPKTILVVATHPGLAHKLAVLKERIKKEKNLHVFLIVIDTDDSPQHVWYVDGADLTFVPSERTKAELLRFGKKYNLVPIQIEVAAYPVSPLLAKSLSESKLTERKNQLEIDEENQIQVAIPISGAAVGLDFVHQLVEQLSRKSLRFRFSIIVRSAFYTQKFITSMLSRNDAEIETSEHTREVVDKYIEVYQKHTISLEVTKPSEQAFKALLTPKQIGGSILLLTRPVGRQEYDNLYFLRRHNLVPLISESKILLEKAKSENTNLDQKLLAEATTWRGLELPTEPADAAQFIWYCLGKGVFTQMLKSRVQPKVTDEHAHELSPYGVEKIWEKIAQHLQTSVNDTS